jgi:flavin-dependent dehydrogenase
VGDAAIAFDPIAGQGIFNAMYLGLSAAEAAHRLLCDDVHARSQYVAEVARIGSSYMARRAAWYGLERRWADTPFWSRRQANINDRKKGVFTQTCQK